MRKSIAERKAYLYELGVCGIVHNVDMVSRLLLECKALCLPKRPIGTFVAVPANIQVVG